MTTINPTNNEESFAVAPYEFGMSLRDIVALRIFPTIANIEKIKASDAAQVAFFFADAFVAERKKRKA